MIIDTQTYLKKYVELELVRCKAKLENAENNLNKLINEGHKQDKDYTRIANLWENVIEIQKAKIAFLEKTPTIDEIIKNPLYENEKWTFITFLKKVRNGK